jgi:single-strand DNA-binding protein
MGFAKVQLMGNLGKDPEVFSFEGRNGKSEGVKFPVAVNRGKDDSKVTDWFECLCFGQTAKTAKEWLLKGKTVIVFGKLSFREWEGKDGKLGHSTEVIADDIQFVPNGGGNGASGGANGKTAVPNGGDNRQAAVSADIDDGDCPF